MLYIAPLYYTVVRDIIQYCTLLHTVRLFYTLLYCTILLYYTALHFIQ